MYVQSLWLLTLIFMALGCLQKLFVAIERVFLLLESLTLEVFSNKYNKEKITKWLKHSGTYRSHT